MHFLRDALLSPISKGLTDITPSDRAAADRQSVLGSIVRGEIEQVRIGAFTNRAPSISHRDCGLGDGVDSLESSIHSLGHIYYQLGQVTSHETSDQDRLVLDIVRIQGLGPLIWPVSGNYGIGIARTIEGTLWNDLPFLATDMTEFWIVNCAALPASQRLNLASFLAKLASTSKEEEEDSCRDMQDLSIANLLPAACAWVREANYNLIQLSELYWNDCPSMISQGGKCFIESDLGVRSPTGFTPWRWMYWLKRLHEIRDEAHEADEERLVTCATKAIDYMVAVTKDRNCEILRAYQRGGQDLHEDPHLKVLAREHETGLGQVG